MEGKFCLSFSDDQYGWNRFVNSLFDWNPKKNADECQVLSFKLLPLVTLALNKVTKDGKIENVETKEYSRVQKTTEYENLLHGLQDVENGKHWPVENRFTANVMLVMLSLPPVHDVRNMTKRDMDAKFATFLKNKSISSTSLTWCGVTSELLSRAIKVSEAPSVSIRDDSQKENEALKQKITSAKTEKEKIEAQKKECENRVDSLQEEKKQQTQRIADQSEKIKSLNEANQTSQMQIQEKIQQAKQLEEQISKIEKQLSALQKENEQLRDSSASNSMSSSDQVEQLEKEANELKKKISDLESQLSIMSSESEQCKSEKSQLTQKLENIESEMETLQNQNKDLSDVKNDLETQIKRLETEKQTLQEKNEKLTQEIAKLRQETQQAAEMLKQLNAQIENTQKIHQNEVEKLKTQLQTDKETHKNELQDEKQKQKNHQDKVDELNTEMENLKTQLEENQKTHQNEMQDEKKKNQQKIQAYEEWVAQSFQTAQNGMEMVETMSKETVKQFQSKNEAFKAEFEKVKKDYENVKGQNEQLREKLKNMREQLKTSETENDTNEQIQRMSERIIELETLNESVSSNLDDLAESNQTLTNRMQQITGHLSTLKNEVVRLENIPPFLLEQIESLQANINGKVKQIETKNQKILSMQNDLNGMIEQLTRSEAENLVYEEANTRLREQNERLGTQIKQFVTDQASINEQIQTLTKANEDENSEKIKMLKKDLEEKTNEIENLRSQVQNSLQGSEAIALYNQYQNLEQEYKDINAQYFELVNIVQDIEFTFDSICKVVAIITEQKEEMESKNQQLTQTLQEKINNTDKENEQLKGQIQGLNKEIEELKNKIVGMKKGFLGGVQARPSSAPAPKPLLVDEISSSPSEKASQSDSASDPVSDVDDSEDRSDELPPNASSDKNKQEMFDYEGVPEKLLLRRREDQNKNNLFQTMDKILISTNDVNGVQSRLRQEVKQMSSRSLKYFFRKFAEDKVIIKHDSVTECQNKWYIIREYLIDHGFMKEPETNTLQEASKNDWQERIQKLDGKLSDIKEIYYVILYFSLDMDMTSEDTTFDKFFDSTKVTNIDTLRKQHWNNLITSFYIDIVIFSQYALSQKMALLLDKQRENFQQQRKHLTWDDVILEYAYYGQWKSDTIQFFMQNLEQAQTDPKFKGVEVNELMEIFYGHIESLKLGQKTFPYHFNSKMLENAVLIVYNRKINLKDPDTDKYPKSMEQAMPKLKEELKNITTINSTKLHDRNVMHRVSDLTTCTGNNDILYQYKSMLNEGHIFRVLDTTLFEICLEKLTHKKVDFRDKNEMIAFFFIRQFYVCKGINGTKWNLLKSAEKPPDTADTPENLLEDIGKLTRTSRIVERLQPQSGSGPAKKPSPPSAARSELAPRRRRGGP